MKNITLALMAALTLALCESSIAVGQFSYQTGQLPYQPGQFSYQAGQLPYQTWQLPYQTGQFGYRAFGQTLAPPPYTFSGGLPTSMPGRFPGLGQPPWNSYSLPWQQSYQGVGGLPGAALAFPPQPAAGPMQMTPAPDAAAAPFGSPAPLPPPGYNAPAPFPEQGTVVAPGVGIGPAWNYATGRSVNRMVAARAEPYVRSPELSALATRIARTRGMSAGPVINVYLSGNVALLQGVVRTAGDRTVIGNVLGLEPNVSQIDNRLVVQRNVGGR
jgi:hypothetical protein